MENKSIFKKNFNSIGIGEDFMYEKKWYRKHDRKSVFLLDRKNGIAISKLIQAFDKKSKQE